MSQVTIDPTDPTQALIGSSTEELFGAHQGAAVLKNIHNAVLCEGRACVIHNPSNHHMREWLITWRGDKGVFERHCPHGIGHPDPDDAEYLIATGRESWTVHGCDSCCVSNDTVIK